MLLVVFDYVNDWLANDSHNVGFFHDQQVFTVDLDFCTAPFSEKDTVAFFHVKLAKAAVIIACAGTDGNDFAFGGFLCRGIGDDDPARCLSVFFYALNNNAVMQRTKFHNVSHYLKVDEFSTHKARVLIESHVGTSGGTRKGAACDFFKKDGGSTGAVLSRAGAQPIMGQAASAAASDLGDLGELGHVHRIAYIGG